MAGFAKPEIRLAQPFGWYDQLAALLGLSLHPARESSAQPFE